MIFTELFVAVARPGVFWQEYAVCIQLAATLIAFGLVLAAVVQSKPGQGRIAWERIAELLVTTLYLAAAILLLIYFAWLNS